MVISNERCAAFVDFNLCIVRDPFAAAREEFGEDVEPTKNVKNKLKKTKKNY